MHRKGRPIKAGLFWFTVESKSAFAKGAQQHNRQCYAVTQYRIQTGPMPKLISIGPELVQIYYLSHRLRLRPQ